MAVTQRSTDWRTTHAALKRAARRAQKPPRVGERYGEVSRRCLEVLDDAYEPLTTAEVADLAGLDRPRAYGALALLRSAGKVVAFTCDREPPARAGLGAVVARYLALCARHGSERWGDAEKVQAELRRRRHRISTRYAHTLEWVSR